MRKWFSLMTTNLCSPFCHVVIPAPDLGKAKLFYEVVFNWCVQENVPGPNYWFFQSGNVSGAFSREKHPSRQSTILVLEVDDMESTLDQIKQHGGTVTQDRSRIGNAAPGYDAYFIDPNGNEMGVYSAT